MYHLLFCDKLDRELIPWYHLPFTGILIRLTFPQPLVNGFGADVEPAFAVEDLKIIEQGGEKRSRPLQAVQLRPVPVVRVHPVGAGAPP